MKMQRDVKHAYKAGRRQKPPSVGKRRYLVSVWLEDQNVWLDDIHFRWIEDAKVHAARWARLYGATLTQISEVDL